MYLPLLRNDSTAPLGCIACAAPTAPNTSPTHPPPSHSVDMGEEEDELQGAITSCLASLLLGIETRLEGALAAMARLNWAGMEMVRGGWGAGSREAGRDGVPGGGQDGARLAGRS